MATPILVQNLRKKRDVIIARQRGRQIAGLLGFDAREQTCIAAAVFEIARNTLRYSRRSVVAFQVEGDMLQIFPVVVKRGAIPIRMEKPLPKDGAAVGPDDLEWVVEE